MYFQQLFSSAYADAQPALNHTGRDSNGGFEGDN